MDIRENFYSKLQQIREGADKPENMITDFKDRQAYLGARKMQDDFNKRSRSTKNDIKKHHYSRMSDQHSETANRILDKYRTTKEEPLKKTSNS